MKIIVVVFSVLLALLIFAILHDKREISRFSKELGDVLDDMIAGKDPDFAFTDESLLGKINIKLKRLYEILHRKSEESKQDKERLNALISDISHQTKTPIANLKLYHQILAERELDKDKRDEFLALSLAQAEKLEFLMSALVKMSRLENGMISFSIKKMPVIDIIADGLAQIMPSAEKKRIAVHVRCPDDIHGCCDKKWTSEAVFNILDNAVKYAPERSDLSIIVERNEFYALIKIKDSGPGIPESEQAKIFGRFYRSEVAKDVPGLGIGLFLARQIVSGQGGYVIVKSQRNHGAEFTVGIPVE